MSRASTLFYPQAPKKPKSSIKTVEVPDMETISLNETTAPHEDMAASVVDFGRLDHFAHKAYRHCHNAGDDYINVAHEVHKLHNVLRILRDQQEYLESHAFRKDPESTKHLLMATVKVRETLEELDIMIEKFENRKKEGDKDNENVMSAAKRKIWSRLKNGTKKEELAVIKFKLINYTTTIGNLLNNMKVVSKPRSRQHSRVRRPERRNSDISIKSDNIPIGGSSTRSTPRGSGTNTPLSTSPPDKLPPASVPSRLLDDRKHARRGSDVSAASDPDFSKSGKGAKDDHQGHRRRRRSSSVLSLENPPKPDLSDFPASKKDIRSPRSGLSTVSRASDLDLVQSKSYSPRNSKTTSPTESHDMQSNAGPEGKANASRSASEPASPMIDALNLDYFRRASGPARNSGRASSRRDNAARSHRMSWQLDDVKEVPEKPTTPPASKLSTVAISEASLALKPEESKDRSPSTPGSRAVSPTTIPTEKAEIPPTKPAEATDKPPPHKTKAKPMKPTLNRTMSGRPFADPWKALTMDTKQLKALRAEASKAEAQKAEAKKVHELSRSESRSEPSHPKLIKEASSKSDSKSDISRFSPPTTGALTLKKTNKYKADAKTRRKRRSKYSWYKTLNNVKSMRSLRSELAPATNGYQLKSILKGPANLKKDPGAREGSVPPKAQFTKISRKVVCPEALELGHEKFEIKDDNVIVLRVLSRVEIDGYASRTKDIRGEFRCSPHLFSYTFTSHPSSFMGI